MSDVDFVNEFGVNCVSSNGSNIPLSRLIALPYTSCAGATLVRSLTFVLRMRIMNGMCS